MWLLHQGSVYWPMSVGVCAVRLAAEDLAQEENAETQGGTGRTGFEGTDSCF